MNAQLLTIVTDGNEFGAAFTDELGYWHCELCATAKAAWVTLANKIEPDHTYFLSNSTFFEAEAYFEEDAKEDPDYSSFDPDMSTFLNELSWECSQNKNRLRKMIREDKAEAKHAMEVEQERLR